MSRLNAALAIGAAPTDTTWHPWRPNWTAPTNAGIIARVESPPSVDAARVHVLIPIYNDWDVVALLIPQLDRVLFEHRLLADVVLVDDGSTIRPDAFACAPARAIRSLSILELRRNLGHQRAIAIGLTYLQQVMNPQSVVVMDGDGEDNPEDVPRLVEKLRAEGNRKIVFAERRRRSEPLWFASLYHLYRFLHRLLTGHGVRVGNFSVIPAVALSRLVVISEMWNHYAASVFNARIDRTTVPTSRGKRISGQSHMNFISLVVHGLSALSVYSHIIGVRILVMSGVLLGTVGALLVAMLGFQMTRGTLVPASLYVVVGFLLLALFQALTLAIGFVFIMLSGRHSASMIPLRDYTLFVQRFVEVYATTAANPDHEPAP